MKRNWLAFALIGFLAVGQFGLGRSNAQELSIYDVQYTTDPSGDSPYFSQIRDVAGGIVTHKWAGFNQRIYLQDPADATWGAIVVKDGEDGELYDAVEVGDWVSFDDIYVDEYRGTTFLQYRRSQAPDVSFTVESSGNTVPDPTLLSVADLAAPIEDPQDYWLVADRHSEPYESMIATLQNLTVGTMDLGKADDNYELIQGGNIAWGADYMNLDAGGPYHPSIYAGAKLLRITGVVEHYYKITDTYGWDYYQLVTRSDADIVPAPDAALDVKPGSCPNSFNRGSHGVLPVALLGSEDFDVLDVDVGTVRLARADGLGGSVAPHEGPPGPHSVYEDVATPFQGEPCDCHQAGPDGFLDLSMKFKTDDVVGDLLLDELEAGALVELVVTGSLLDGTPFAATDCIRLVPPSTPPPVVEVMSNAAGAWIEVEPLDLQLDGGGSANFKRTYPLGNVVTLTAEPGHEARRFVGWRLDGEFQTTDLSANVVVTGELHTVEALLLRPGDMDDDGHIDLSDLATFAVCYGSVVSAPLPGCLPEQAAACDLDGDGSVDLSDFATFAVNYSG